MFTTLELTMEDGEMPTLSTSNLLWYIYRRNCAVGYLTVISMSQFLPAFPLTTRKSVEKEFYNSQKRSFFKQ